mmetsp:Transcript_8807/g.22952  ORF Transcript_8807/g.22952 Transcript_8807/m.22952 type:complete len:360 (-) Transcript_8807:570-1649(-)
MLVRGGRGSAPEHRHLLDRSAVRGQVPGAICHLPRPGRLWRHCPRRRRARRRQGVRGADVSHDASPQRDGQHSLRGAEAGEAQLLHDKLRGGGHPYGECRRAGRRGRRLRAVPGGGGAAVAGVHHTGGMRSVRRQRGLVGQGEDDAGSLWKCPAQLPHHLLPPCDAAPAGGGGRLRAEDAGQGGVRGVLLRRRCRQRGRLPRCPQLRSHPGLPGRVFLQEQRVRHQHPHQRAVQGGWHRGQGGELQHQDGAVRRQRRLRRARGDEGSAPHRGARGAASPGRSNDLQGGAPLDVGRCYAIPGQRGGVCLGKHKQPHCPHEDVSGEEGVARGGGGGGVQGGGQEGGARGPCCCRGKAQARG